jgi:hypothetical protein
VTRKRPVPLIEHTARKTVPCRRCGDPLARSMVLREAKDRQDARSVEDICAELRARAEAWLPTDDLCELCEARPGALLVSCDNNQKVRTI